MRWFEPQAINFCSDFFQFNLMNSVLMFVSVPIIYSVRIVMFLSLKWSLSSSNRKDGTGGKRIYDYPAKLRISLSLKQTVYASLLAEDMSIESRTDQNWQWVWGEEYKNIKLSYLHCATLKLPQALPSVCKTIRNSFPYQQNEVTVLFDLRTF